MTTLPEEAVKAAIAAHNKYYDDLVIYPSEEPTPEGAFHAALKGALPFLPVQGAVKKLEWEMVSGDHYAEGAGTHYNIYETKPGLWNSVTVKPGNVRLATNVDLEAAKAAAQADYEARILSALEPSAPDMGNPITLTYTNYRGETSERTITPIRPWFGSTEWHPEPQWLLRAYDHDKSAERDFALKDFGRQEPSAAREQALEALRSAEQFIENGFEFGFIRKPDEGDTALETLPKIKAAIRALSSPDHADSAPERAWYFKSGDTVPEWLGKIERGNCTLTFGVDAVVTSKDGGYEVRPQGIADNAGPILHVVSHGNVTPEIKGGGNGVAIIGDNRPYDETAEWRVARLKRLLEMARPYVECYDTREHNSEQDAVITEIDKALSVVVAGTHADAGKVEGDGWLPIESAPKDGTVIDLWSAEFGRQPDCFWGKREHHCGENGQYCDSDWHSEPEMWIDSAQNTETFDDITHWRPLPSAPSQEGAGS